MLGKSRYIRKANIEKALFHGIFRALRRNTNTDFQDQRLPPLGHLSINDGIDISYQAVARQVFSAQTSLTTVFGMGTGGSLPS